MHACASGGVAAQLWIFEARPGKFTLTARSLFIPSHPFQRAKNCSDCHFLMFFHHVINTCPGSHLDN